MRRQEMMPTACNNAATLSARPSGLTVAGRLLGLDAGDWSMVLLGLLLSGLLLTVI
jgi:hypothetical protein